MDAGSNSAAPKLGEGLVGSPEECHRALRSGYERRCETVSQHGLEDERKAMHHARQVDDVGAVWSSDEKSARLDHVWRTVGGDGGDFCEVHLRTLAVEVGCVDRQAKAV